MGAAEGLPFQFQCRRCRCVLEAPRSRSGTEGKCPSCNAVFLIPAFDPVTGVALGPADPGDDGQNPTPVHAYAAAGQYAPKLIRLEDDRLVIECPRCGNRSPVDANNCSACGHPFTMDGAMQVARPTRESGAATASLVVGIIGLVLAATTGVGGILGVIAIALAAYERSVRKSRRLAPVWTGNTVAGLVCGILAAAIGLLVLGAFLL